MQTESNHRPAEMHGLDQAEAEARLARFGPNVLQQKSGRSLAEIVRGTLREPMFLFLLAAAALYLIVGDLGEGSFLIAGAIVSIGLVVFQESRSERALAALRELAEPFSHVIRSGLEHRIPARDLVPGDIVLVGEGDRLPIDGVLIAGDLITVDESMLTGESVPATKYPARTVAEAATLAPPGSDHSPALFAGTLVVRGQGIARAIHTGQATQLGRIGASLAAIQMEPTLLQRTSARLIGKLAVVALVFCGLVAVTYGVVRNEWFEGALAGITLAISLLPEEFPMVLAIFMAIGSWRLAHNKVLVRRAAVLETLGAATMLCVDKTGTLTENRMTVSALWFDGALHEVSGSSLLRGSAAHLLGRAALASAIRPIDPMDRAVRDLSQNLDIDATPGGAPVSTHPLRPALLAVIQAWAEDQETTIVAAKGAPEAIFGLCRMDVENRQRMNEIVVQMADRGLRVLGVASCRHKGPATEDLSQTPFTFEGLVGFFDPVRPDVPETLAIARRAGIGVAMITGDYPATALEIARRCGLDVRDGVLTGHEIAGLGLAQLRKRIEKIRVFARILPEQKLSLVEAFKANGEIVAMTGDGINDAPALEAAHIGIAMGLRGSDVAREAADIVLLDDSFVSIVGGIRLGRRIFTNLRKALTYVAAIHVPVAGLALFPLVLGLPPMLFPMHVVLLELVIDPVCSLVFESEPSEKNAMNKPPRPANESVFGVKVLLFGLLQGMIVLTGVLTLYAGALASGIPAPEARAVAFVALIAANLALAFADSAEVDTSFFDRRRLSFWVIGASATVMLGVILSVPAAARTFSMSLPHPSLIGLAIAVAVVAGGWYGFLRRLGHFHPAA